MTWLGSAWRSLRTNFWFLPAVILAGSILLAIGLTMVEPEPGPGRWSRLFGAEAASARTMMSTIAGSMMTVVGVTFSMTLVTLALASSQYTSRILRTFMRDRMTQMVLGIFAGIFTYCLIVMHAIRSDGQSISVPSLAVTVGVVLATGGIGILIYFIHHIASSIQASSIIAAVGAETEDAIDRLFPGRLGGGPAGDDPDAPASQQLAGPWHAVPATRSGYIQRVDPAGMLRVAGDRGVVVRMVHGIGDFVVEGCALAEVTQAAPDAALRGALQRAYVIGTHRTLEQDAAFGIRQIVDVALRALSPGINDTTTAVMCIDHLAAILVRLAGRDIPAPDRFVGGALRIVAIGPTFAALTALAFDQIRGSAAGNVAIMVRLTWAFGIIASQTDDSARRGVLTAQAHLLRERARRTVDEPRSLIAIEERLAVLLAGLDRTTGPAPKAV